MEASTRVRGLISWAAGVPPRRAQQTTDDLSDALALLDDSPSRRTASLFLGQLRGELFGAQGNDAERGRNFVSHAHRQSSQRCRFAGCLEALVGLLARFR